MPKPICLIGRTFGRLKVIGEAPSKRWPNGVTARQSTCVCSCNPDKTVVVLNQSLRDGFTRSCGCLLRETATKHGMVRTKAYYVWQSLIQRCTNPDCPSYKDYGARGIKVHPQWLTNFRSFFLEVGEPPVVKGHRVSIGRINNNGDYVPGNVRWETPFQQAQNMRTNAVFTVNGVTACLYELARHFGLPVWVPRNRLKLGWTVQDAFTKPLRVYKHTGARAKKAPTP